MSAADALASYSIPDKATGQPFLGREMVSVSSNLHAELKSRADRGGIAGCRA
jgi:hypothetical protein